MRWLTMIRQLDRHGDEKLAKQNAYALLRDSRTGEMKRVYLALATDYRGNPYFLQDLRAQAAYARSQDKKFHKN